MKMRWTWAAALGLMPLATANIYTFSSAPNVAYSVTVPNSTLSNSDAVYFQIIAATSYQWVALGQGSQMAGSNMFIMYASSAHNITVSPRLGTGHVEPQFNPHAHFSILERSGMSNGYMTANIRCESCLHWPGGSLDSNDSSSNWIWAVKQGNPLDSTDTSASISQHDSAGAQTIDLTKATLSSLNITNPFLNYNRTFADAVPGNGGSSSSATMLIAHGLLMGLAFVILFPSFAISLHIIPYTKTVTRIHAPLQLFTLCVALTGLGIGVYLGVTTNQMNTYHPIIGLIVVGGLLLVQPLMGLSQHLHFRRTGGKAWFAYMHRWFGRMTVLLGIVNGGLGFLLAGIGSPGVPMGAVVVYSVVAGVFVITYFVILVVKMVKARLKSEDLKSVPLRSFDNRI